MLCIIQIQIQIQIYLSAYLAVLAYELAARIDEPLHEIRQQLSSCILLEHFGQLMDPGGHDGAPTQCGRLQVDHATPGYRGRL